MLEVKNICKTYKAARGIEAHAAIQDVSINFGDKGLIVILGKSGSGKSTMLNMLSGLDHPDTGEIIIAGKSSTDFTQSDFDTYRNTYVGFVFQDFSLIDGLSVYENIALSVKLQGKKIKKDRIDEALAKVELAGKGDRKPNQLSGGQKQRIAIARALIRDPRIIFADEPTGNLDSGTSRMMFDMFKELSKDRLVILVSHDVDSALEYADRIIELQDGKLVRDITKNKPAQLEQLKADYQKHVDACFVPTPEIAVDTEQQFKRVKSHLPIKEAVKMGFSSFSMRRWRLLFTMFIAVLTITLYGLAMNLKSYNAVDSSVNSFKYLGIDTLLLNKYQDLTAEEIDDLDGVNLPKEDFKYKTLDKMAAAGIQTAFGVIPWEMRPRIPNEPAEVDIFDPKPKTNLMAYTTADVFDAAALKLWYGATLLAGRYPEVVRPTSLVEVMISDFTADAYIATGVLLTPDNINAVLTDQDTTYADLVGMRLVPQIDIKIVGIYSTDYKTMLSDVNAPRPKKRYAVGSIYPAMLCAKGAIAAVRENNGGTGAGVFVSNDEELKKWNWQECQIWNIEKLHFPNYPDPLSYTWAPGYDATTPLADDEMVISLSLYNNFYSTPMGTLPEATYFDDDFHVAIKFNNGATTDDHDYAHPMKVVGVVQNWPARNLYAFNPKMYSTLVAEQCLPSLVVVSIAGNTSAQNRAIVKYVDANNLGLYTWASGVLKGFSSLFGFILGVFDYAAIALLILVIALLYNFFSSAIHAKKRDIGILRAMGARGIDIAKVFSIQGVLVCAVIMALSIVLTIFGMQGLNGLITKEIQIPLVIVFLRPLTLLTLAGICVGVVAAACIIPLVLITRQKPINAIKLL